MRELFGTFPVMGEHKSNNPREPFLIFWKQPGNATMKVGLKHIPTKSAKRILDIFRDEGFQVTDHGSKITVER